MVWKTADKLAPKKFKAVRSARKVLCTVFWDSQGVIHEEYLEYGNTVTGDGYFDTLKRLRRAIKSKWPGLLLQGVILLHDKARPHVAKLVVSLLTDFGYMVFQYPPYSPDLARLTSIYSAN